MKRYSVSLVFTKEGSGSTTVGLRVLITSAHSKNEALGNAIKKFEDDTKDFTLKMHIIIDVNSSQEEAESS